MGKSYDVVIIGGGPAGIFAALELSQAEGLSILLLERGKDIHKRDCPLRKGEGNCFSCSPCHLVCGLGGAGAFSDGKLTISSKVGGRIKDYVGEEEAEKNINYVDQVYLKFGAPQKLYGVGEEVEKWQKKARICGMHLTPVPIRHMGTENGRKMVKLARDYLSPRIDIQLETKATSIITEDGELKGIETDKEERINTRFLILAPGREGSDWLAQEATKLGLSIDINPIDLGVRVEVPAVVTEDLTSALYEPKLEFYSKRFDDRIRTFCVCPHGEVTLESTGGEDPVITVNGHSYADRDTQNTNFALLVSTTFTYPFREPIAYGKYVAHLANLLGGVLVQRLGDLEKGRRSTPERISRSSLRPSLAQAIPGDLSFALPFRHLQGIMEMIYALDELVPGVASPHTILYGVEVKFYSSRLKLDSDLQTEIRNMFAVGDGAGVSRGLIQASASGVVAARKIIKDVGARWVRSKA
jgi:hypothetical protein